MTKKQLALDLLVRHGEAGVSNSQLVDGGVGYRYGAVLHALREEGYRIDTLHEGGALYRYVLKERPSPAVSTFTEPVPEPRGEERLFDMPSAEPGRQWWKEN